MDFRELFYLQKSDRKVLAFLLCLALAVLGAMFLLGNKHGRTPLNAADSSAFAAQQGLNRGKNTGNRSHYELENGKNIELFPFDPKYS